MGRLIKKIFILAGLFAAVSSTGLYGQCNSDELTEKCSGNLQGFTYLKAYKLTGAPNGEIEYSYVFSKDTQYFISICDSKGNAAPEIEVKLLGKEKDKVLATNFYNGKYFSSIAYKCTGTGIYYMSYKINNPTSSCSVSVIGFKK